jgi:hypothetical protein
VIGSVIAVVVIAGLARVESRRKKPCVTLSTAEGINAKRRQEIIEPGFAPRTSGILRVTPWASPTRHVELSRTLHIAYWFCHIKNSWMPRSTAPPLRVGLNRERLRHFERMNGLRAADSILAQVPTGANNGNRHSMPLNRSLNLGWMKM